MTRSDEILQAGYAAAAAASMAYVLEQYVVHVGSRVDNNEISGMASGMHTFLEELGHKLMDLGDDIGEQERREFAEPSQPLVTTKKRAIAKRKPVAK